MSPEERVRVVSFGGGVQSSALVALAATRHPGFEAVMGGRVTDAVFANVGDDSEDPLVLPWVRDVVSPWAAERGVTVHEERRVRRDGEERTLLEHLHQSERSVPIPVRMPDTSAPGRRSCTSDFKLSVVERWVKARGATRDYPAAVAVGFSTDEADRVGGIGKGMARQERRFPLLSPDVGMSRDACQALNVSHYGSPAPSSSCWFCPFHTPAKWAEMRRDRPGLFDEAVRLERTLNDRREMLGRDHVYFTRFGRPLDRAVGEAQTPLFEGDGHTIGEAGCDEGGCFT